MNNELRPDDVRLKRRPTRRVVIPESKDPPDNGAQHVPTESELLSRIGGLRVNDERVVMRAADGRDKVAAPRVNHIMRNAAAQEGRIAIADDQASRRPVPRVRARRERYGQGVRLARKNARYERRSARIPSPARVSAIALSFGSGARGGCRRRG